MLRFQYVRATYDPSEPPTPSSLIDVAKHVIATSCCTGLARASGEYEQYVEPDTYWCGTGIQPLVISVVVELLRKPEKEIMRFEVRL